jgi:hypothetical protein
MGRSGRLDGLALVGLAFFAFMILNVLKDQGYLSFGFDQGILAAESKVSPSQVKPASKAESESTLGNLLPSAESIDSDTIAPPYKHYMLTQGPHDIEYSQLAIDIYSGKGAPILSPINGWVANLFIDERGNSSLVLENYRYVVDLLHGLYTVKIGDQVKIGQPVGQESNQGNTFDPWGVSCRGRDCGYHTHINVYDKMIGANLNPLDLFPTQQ